MGIYLSKERGNNLHIFVKLFIQNEKIKQYENVIIQKKSDQIMLKDVYL
jgi:hypothetical protein